MAPRERPEDERAAGDEPGERPDAAPSDEPDEATAAATDEGGARRPSGGDRPPRHGALKAFVALGGLLALALLLVGWNRVATSDGFCASCHDMEASVSASDRSVHADVPCLACHTSTGLVGTLRYTPTLVREMLDTFTGWDVAHGVLDARPCEDCHTDLARTPELAAAHGDDAPCASCHGDVAHPPFRLAGFARPVEQVPPGESPHPRLYVQTHGDDAVREQDTCAECHETDFCETCHLRETYPHPDGWISTHGPTQQETGITACEGCHPETFCAGCHGTEIPHGERWLGEHWRALQDASTAPCMLCHPRTDCTECHARHEVHQEQGLYA